MTELDLQALLRDLWSQGVELWLENEQLRFKGNKKLLSGDVLKTLREHKSDIIGLLQQQPLAYSGFPLSHGQRGIYLMQSMAPHSAAYNQACLLKLCHDLDTNLLESSLDILLQRHAPLRMSIENLDGHLAQQVSYSLPSILSIHSAPVRSPDGWQQWLDIEADRPFQLNSEPLIRAKLLVTDGDPADHFLLLVTHHIIADFWTLNLIIKELESIYLAGLTDKTPDLPEINKLYKDYVIDEQEWLKSAQGQAAKQYWHQQLTPLPPTLELPGDFIRPSQQSYQGQEISFNLGPQLSQRIKQQARAAQVTPFVWVLSCYQLLMHRYSGENDIAIGSPVACRTQKDFQLLAGHFTNPVVLRTRFEQPMAFRQLLEHNKNSVLKAMKHQQYPLQQLIEELHPAHHLHNSPLFQVAISWNQLSDNHDDDGRLIEQVVSMEQRGAIYQLVLTCYDKGDDIQVSWRFNSDLYRERSIQRYQQHLVNVLTGSCDDADRAVSEIRFLTDQEKRLIETVNDNASDYPRNSNLASLFRKKNLEFPDAIALRDVESNTEYSYRTLERDSNRLANYLARQGIGEDDHIVLCLARSYEMLTGILACLKLGAVYIPLDPDYPEQRIQAIIDNAHARAMISKNLHTLSASVDCSIALDQMQAAIVAAGDDFAIARQGNVAPDSIACVFYTSGSTGTPKGVQVPHRAVARLVLNTNYMQIHPGDRFCHFSNVAFDASNIEIWFALLHGASLLCISNNTLLSPGLFAHFVEQEKPTAAFITTALFNVLINYRADMFRHFTYLLFGGEAADNNTVNACIRAGKPEHLYNVYGPTENGSLSTAYEIISEHDQTVIPIGFVLSNNQAYIHDPYGQPAPIGVTGELILGGDGIAAGYLGRADLTAASFIADTHTGQGLLYRTGDMAWLRDDGMIVYAGRRDDMVKIRGFRIELSEIEQALNKHPYIRQCCVITSEQQGQKQLLAYFVADSPLSAVALKQFLRQSLPLFMLPSAFMQLPELPLTANGKIDKKRLPPIEVSRSNDYVAPRNDREKLMAAIWQQVLGIHDIGIHDNFFELGGHSLLAVKLAGTIQEQLHIDINMRMIFEKPDIASLVEWLENHQSRPLPELLPASIEGQAIPASLSQQRLWFLQQLNPQSTAYNMPLALRFSRPLKASKAEKAIQRLIQRHQPLRTTFVDTEGEACLQLHDGHDWQLPTLDFSRLPASRAEQQAADQIQLLTNQVFDLQQGPLIKAVLIKLTAGEHILAFCLHHIIIDGWSVNILLHELGLALAHDDDKLLPAPRLQYSDFILWQRSWLQGDLLKDQLQYWQQQLADAEPLLNLPTDKPRPPVLSQQGAQYHFSINQQTIEQLQSLGQQHNASLFMVMLAGFAILLSRYSRQHDVCVGFPVSGRNHNALEPLIGLFVNNLVIRSGIADKPSVIKHIRNIRKTTLEAYANQDAPFDLIVDALKLERSLSYTPLLQASFSLETETFEEKIRQALGADVKQQALGWHTAKYDINLSCFESSGDMQACIEYSTDLYQEDTIARMAGHYRQLLEHMLQSPDQPVDELPILEPQEQQQFVPDWQKQRELNRRTFINAVNRFEIQAGKYARQTALCFQGQQLSYQALNEKANQLARLLQQQGIGAGQFVGLYLKRSQELVISILAVLKTGAAYIPLDPHSPRERVSFIIDDAGIKHVLSSSELCQQLGTNCLAIDTLQEDINRQSCDNLNIHIPIDAGAYVIYTSGTTGKPKGCLVSHRNLARLFTVTEDCFAFDHKDVWTLFHSYAFDFSVWEMWGALLYGGRLVVVPYWLSRSPESFYRLLQDEKVTILNQTPSAFSQLIAIDREQDNSDLHLRHIIFGGEALDFSALKQWISRHPLQQTALTNMYGITETTVHVTHHRISAQDLQAGRSIIGQPLFDLHIHLLDENCQRVPLGVTGEMYISGPGVTRGYLHREALTAERFLVNPFAAELPDDIACHHRCMYRSGDLARRLANGDIEYLGRIDHQVKIRGHRIELGEIENALNQLPAIQESLVLAQSDQHGHQQLLAWLLTKPETAITHSELRQQLKSVLPEYMLPAAFITVHEWPLTANGKIDQAALPQVQEQTASSEYVAPRNDTELAICAIWSEVLGIEKIGIHDNFFELGGHSLLATRVAARIRSRLDCNLELRLLFEHPTVAELALVILEQEIDDLDINESDLESLLNELEQDEK